MNSLSSKGIRFSGDSIKSCVGFIDLVDLTKNITTMEGLNIRKYYSTFINSVSNVISSSNGKVIKNIGDCLLFYFPKTSDINDANSFQNGIGCCFIFITALDILDELLSIVLGIPKEQIMRKPVDKKVFTNTVNNLLN